MTITVAPHLTITPAKLRDGSWGVRAKGPGAEKLQTHTVSVRTRDGSTFEAFLDCLMWDGTEADGQRVALYRSKRVTPSARVSGTDYRTTGDAVARRAASATRAAGGHACRSCGGPVQSYSNGAGAGLCHDCC